jgi:hypothetical protein
MPATDPSLAAGSGDPSQEPVFPLTGNWLAVPGEVNELVGLATTELLPNLDEKLQDRLVESDRLRGFELAKNVLTTGLAANQLDSLVLAHAGTDKGGPVLSHLRPELWEDGTALDQLKRREAIIELINSLRDLRADLAENMDRPSSLGFTPVANWFDYVSRVGISLERAKSGSVRVILKRNDQAGHIMNYGDLTLIASVDDFNTNGHQKNIDRLRVELNWLTDRKPGYRLDESAWIVDMARPGSRSLSRLAVTNRRNLGSRLIAQQYNFGITKTGSTFENSVGAK